MTDDPQLYARSFADVYDDWYGALDDPTPLVTAFTSCCAAGATILELGSGTGRLATPLADAGFEVLALDAAEDMLQAAPGGPNRLAADMAELPVAAGRVDAVLIAYNTLFNLPTRQLQQQCFDECARVLRPGGKFVIEAFIAVDRNAGFGVSTRSHPTEPGAHLAIVTGPDEFNPDVIVGSHIELARSTTCRPWRLVYQSPAQLDRAAASAGLHLCDRHNGWTSDAYDPDGLRHVSWYERI